MIIRNLIAVVALALPAITFAEGTSPWLPIPGSASFTLNYTYQDSNDAYILGGKKTSLRTITGGGGSEFRRRTTTILAGYGLSESLAVDIAFGYADVELGSEKGLSDEGITDTNIGISWRVADEYFNEYLPTVTLRAAAIIQGSYASESIFAIGNGESGYEVSILLGKQITDSISISSEIGHQNRSHNIPDAHYFFLNGNYQLSDKWGLNVGYSYKEYSGGLDIGDPGFNPTRFQEVNAERELIKIGVGYAFAPNQGVSFNYATVIDGKNTVDDDKIVGISYTYSL